jgi:RHH-type rel operon transcriptional repressor/antitoxin RelB
MPLTVSLGKDLEDRLKELAELTKRPKSFYVKEAMELYLNEMEDKLRATAYPENPAMKSKGGITKDGD